METVSILGAGNFGTALANTIAKNGHHVKLWTIEEEVYESIKEESINKKYLPKKRLSSSISIFMDLEEALSNTTIIIIAVPSTVVRGLIKKCLPLMDDRPRILVDLAKGLEPDSYLRMSQVIEAELEAATCEHSIVALSGPSIAKEIGEEVPTAVMIASEDKESTVLVKETMESELFNIYLSQDVIGLELGGVFKNIIALLIGMCDGRGLGINTKAAFMVAMLQEIIQLGEALGARRETFYGLAGLGDSIATSMSPASRNHMLGEKIGEGLSLEEAKEEMFMVTEGVDALKVAYQAAKDLKIHLPLIEKEYEVLFGDATIEDFVSFFMSKEYTPSL